MAEDKGFEKIIERNGKSIYKIAFVYMKNRFDADDVYQEVLLRYLKYRPHFENCEHEKNWFVAVTINVCKSFKTSAWQRHNVTVDDDSWLQILADNTESREISQDNAVMDALMQLDDDTRLIMQMYYYEGYSIRELTAILKRKESTLQTQLAAGRRKLKEELKKAGEIPQNWEREGK